jgi:integrase
MRPATDGNLDRTRPRVRVQPIVPDLVFHSFRHSHKTWMIADGMPDVAQARRLGHKLPDKIDDIYSHVALEVEARLIKALQRRWTDALTALTTAHNTAEGGRLELPGVATPPVSRAA